MNNWTRMKYQPCMPIGKNGERVTGSEEHILFSRKAASEGIVLLKNENNILPLKKNEKIAVFGKAQFTYFKGRESGEVCSTYIRSIYDALKIQADNENVQLYNGLIDFYINDVKAQLQNGAEPGTTIEPEIPKDKLAEAAEFCDTAIITICRFSRENRDRTEEKGDFYLSDEESRMVKDVKENFKNIIVVLDVAGMVDTGWFKTDKQIGAVLYAMNSGMEGGGAIADILCGAVNPSAKLVDTLAKSFDDYPSSHNFYDSDDCVKYYDDVYVGYRYFETIPEAKEKVNYPFGFGLSYTTFELNDINAEERYGRINISLSVKNTGTVSGKEVIQVYTESPNGKIQKPKYELRAFLKTKELEPNSEQRIELSFDIDEMASYDDLGVCAKSAYIMEKGDYSIYVGTSVRDTKKLEYSYRIEDEFVITKQLAEKTAPVGLEKRLKADGEYESLPEFSQVSLDYEKPPKNEAIAPNEVVGFDKVLLNEISLDAFIVQLSDYELADLMGGKKSIGLSNTGGIGGNMVLEPPELCRNDEERRMRELGIPCAMTVDGPTGIRLAPETQMHTTCWPCATLLASTWNEEIMYGVGKRGALEAKENNISIWLTPGMNIHRTPLCGRNYEYFSEDPLVSGKMSAAKVRGIQSEGVAPAIKHFACNNKETNRFDSNSIVSERALREIYIKGFEICVKEANPWTIMSSYNCINGTHVSENYNLLTGIIRNEWGYDGVIMSDWCNHGLHLLEAKAGNDVKMNYGFPESLMEGFVTGRLSREEAERNVKNILKLLIKLA